MIERAYRSGWRNAMLLKDEPRANEDAGWGAFRAAIAATKEMRDGQIDSPIEMCLLWSRMEIFVWDIPRWQILSIA